MNATIDPEVTEPGSPFEPSEMNLPHLHRETPQNTLLRALVTLHDAKYVSVTTYRKNGLGVATPVEFILREGSVYFRTLADSGKVKRISRNPNVQLAACTVRGKIRGPSMAGKAILLDEVSGHELQEKFAGKYGLLWRLSMKLGRPRSQVVRVILAE